MIKFNKLLLINFYDKEGNYRKYHYFNYFRDNTNKQIKSFDEDFISINSKLESIEIAQIIARIEELIEEKGIEGFDLFEKVFECDQLSFNSLSDLIYHH